jgi:hypothetical protein
VRKYLVLWCALLCGCANLSDAVKVARGEKVAVVPAAAAVAAPSSTPVNPPPVLTVPVNYDLTISWNAVTTYTNGAPLTSTPDYKLYNMSNAALPGFIGYLGNVLSTQRTMTQTGVQCFAISAQVYSAAYPYGLEGPKSSTICVTVSGTAPPTTVPPGQVTPVCTK